MTLEERIVAAAGNRMMYDPVFVARMYRAQQVAEADGRVDSTSFDGSGGRLVVALALVLAELPADALLNTVQLHAALDRMLEEKL